MDGHRQDVEIDFGRVVPHPYASAPPCYFATGRDHGRDYEFEEDEIRFALGYDPLSAVLSVIGEMAE